MSLSWQDRLYMITLSQSALRNCYTNGKIWSTAWFYYKMPCRSEPWRSYIAPQAMSCWLWQYWLPQICPYWMAKWAQISLPHERSLSLSKQEPWDSCDFGLPIYLQAKELRNCKLARLASIWPCFIALLEGARGTRNHAFNGQVALAVLVQCSRPAPGTGGPLGVRWSHLTNHIHDSSFQCQELERATELTLLLSLSGNKGEVFWWK